MMLSQKEIQAVEAVIKECEQKTDAEFVPVLVRQSDLYPAAHFRLAILLALSLPMALYYVPWTFYDPIWYLYTSLGGLILGYVLGYHPKLKRLFSTRFELTEEVRQRASEYFLEHGLHGTHKRSAILIFISLMEKRIEVLADMAVINALTTSEKKTLFREHIKTFQKETKTNGLEKSLSSLLRNITRDLERHLPKSAGSQNELPDVVDVSNETKAPEAVTDVGHINSDSPSTEAKA